MPAPLDTPAGVMGTARHLVVKLGSSLIAPPVGQAGASLDGVAADLAGHLAAGGATDDRTVTIVSSGAVALGRTLCTLTAEGTPARQALSAVGQTALMRRWQDALGAEGLTAAQVLLTADDTEHRRRYLNARAAFRALHGAGLVPVVNENDAVATEELRAGDNDALAARTAGLIGADTLVLLSDVDGLYTGPPDAPGAVHVPFVARGGAGALDTTDMTSRSGVGTGGMASKVRAAGLATGWGVRVIVASGRTVRPLTALAEGRARGTVFEASPAANARRRWLSGRALPTATLRVDEGAARALAGGASLLAVGVTGPRARFAAGDLVAVDGPGGRLGFGLAACDADAVAEGRGRVVVHRDDLILGG